MSILNLLMSHPKFIGPNKFFPVLSNDINPLRAHVKNILFSSNDILMNIKCCIICSVNMSYIYPQVKIQFKRYVISLDERHEIY